MIRISIFLLNLLVFFFASSLLNAKNLKSKIRFASQSDLSQLATEIDDKSGNVIIFIPGILGSKLILKENGSDTILWGGKKTWDSNFQLKDNQVVKPLILNKIEIINFMNDFSYNIYGDALLDLEDQDTSGRTKLRPFPYDWRKSNASSADSLHKWLCDNIDDFKDKSIVFVAHSMGGLVLKNWLMNQHDKGDTCNSTPNALNQLLSIEHIFFVGTPHHGAPKFLTALMGNYKLLDYLVINDYLTWGLNNYGASFESIYELLPIVQSETCRQKQGINESRYFFLRDKFDEEHSVDLFKWELWEQLGLPKINPLEASTYYGETGFLQKQLSRAENMLCKLWSYNPKKFENKITYIFGEGATKDTAEKFVLARWKNAKSKETMFKRFSKFNFSDEEYVVVEMVPGYGDGTVTARIASREGRKGVRSNHSHLEQSGNRLHQSLLDGRVFFKKIKSILFDIKFNKIYKEASTNPSTRNHIVNFFNDNNLLIPRSVNQGYLKTPYDASARLNLVKEVNAQVLSKNEMNFNDIYRLAFNTQDEEFKINGYIEVIAARKVSSINWQWAVNNLADELLDAKDYSALEDITVSAVEEIEASNIGYANKKLKGKLKNKLGWAKYHKGDFAAADKAFLEAIAAGNSNGLSGINWSAAGR